jgi:uncharacterized cupredoxin-like copper-binding protein
MCAKVGHAGLSRLLVVAALAAAILAIAGCSGSESHGTRGREVRVTERDFKIRAAPGPVRAGEVTLAVNNKGPDSHELIVVRSGGSRLPLRSDGMTVDEDSIDHHISGALEPEPPGHHLLKLRLKPGRYELICNMTGHYFGGMRTHLVVQ